MHIFGNLYLFFLELALPTFCSFFIAMTVTILQRYRPIRIHSKEREPVMRHQDFEGIGSHVVPGIGNI